MIRWKDIIHFSVNGNPIPDRRVEKTGEEWRQILTPEEFQITRLKGTERPYTGELCSIFEQGIYQCVCCGTKLFDSTIKFDSSSGWPSFTQPVKENAIKYKKDVSFGMVRVEVMCNTCDGHLGHVFPDGPKPSGLRYCINSAAIKLKKKTMSNIQLATFGGGCFWCTEALFLEVKGVKKVVSGYSGGNVPGKPTYREVCSGLTGHAEVIQVTYDQNIVSYKDLLIIFMTTHDPTQLNRQGADIGTQYRSVIYVHDEHQKEVADIVVKEMASFFDNKIVTEVNFLGIFHEAEKEHQDYYRNNQNAGYCNVVITPKLLKLRKLYADKLK